VRSVLKCHQLIAPPKCNDCTKISIVPVIQRFAQCRLRINAKDHPPPHFHVLLNDGREAWVAISDLKIVHAKVAAREIVDVLDWAKANRALLATTFEELQR